MTILSDHQFQLEEEEFVGALLVKVSGRIDGVNAEKFSGDLEQKFEKYDGRSVILNFEKLLYISSAGLRSILLAAKVLSGRGSKLSLCSMSDSVTTMLKMTGFDKVVDIHETCAAAIAAVRN